MILEGDMPRPECAEAGHVFELAASDQLFPGIVPELGSQDQGIVEIEFQLAVAGYDLGLVPFEGGMGGVGGGGDQVVELADIMLEGMAVPSPVNIQHLHFGAGVPGLLIFRGIFPDIENDPAIAFMRDLPLKPQVEVGKRTVRHQVAASLSLVAGMPVWMKMYGAIIRLPGLTCNRPAIGMPSFQGLAIEQGDPSFGVSARCGCGGARYGIIMGCGGCGRGSRIG